MLLIIGTGLFLTLICRIFLMQASMIANPELVRVIQTVQDDT
jgi:hypothetical protein